MTGKFVHPASYATYARHYEKARQTPVALSAEAETELGQSGAFGAASSQ